MSTARCVQFPGGEHRTNQQTVEKFKEWLKQIDMDGDGRINRRELQDAIRRRGGKFPWWKAQFAVWHADKNRNGVVDEGEVENLIGFAKRELGFIVSAE